ncbi:MAG: SPL family radical SAM protein [Deferrisomatales bacterium]
MTRQPPSPKPELLALREIQAKSVLTRSRIPGADYCVNPYVGCSHACRYCYASFMKRFTGHTEPWGSFVDARVNAPEVLERQLRRARPGPVLLSSVTDPYQPLEGRYRLTRGCLEALLRHRFPVDILTKSPLVLRDLDVLEGAEGVEVGLTVTSDDERMREVFEPGAPPLEARLDALRRLRARGVPTYAFVGPILPMDPERLADQLRGLAGRFYVDRMNYVGKTAALYRQLGLGKWLDPGFVGEVLGRLVKALGRDRVEVC